MTAKCLQFCSRLKKILTGYLLLSKSVQDYIDSTLMNPAAREFEKKIQDSSNCENDTLLELIFFPDEAMQCELENIIEQSDFNPNDEAAIIRFLSDLQLRPRFDFPDQRGHAVVPMTASAAASFVSRLNITRKPAPRLLKAVEKYSPQESHNRLRVCLRNSRFIWSDNKIEFLAAFFQKLTVPDHLPYLDFMLEFFCELPDDNNILQQLCKKKRNLFLNLQSASKAEDRLQKNNMETLMLARIKVPYIDKKSTLEKMTIIDRITLDLFGVLETVNNQSTGACKFELPTSPTTV